MRLKRPLPPQIPVRSLAPSIITLLSMAAGLTGIRFAILGKWEFAFLSILAAGVFDSLDGRVARMLKGTSKFGAELDSLADVVSFGVAPALILYFWTLKDLKGFGWAVALLFAICAALRLARFNLTTDKEDQPGWLGNFFVGLPVPAAANLSFLPMLFSFEFDSQIPREPLITALMMAGFAALMVSRLPTFSFKKLRVGRDQVLPVLLVVGVFVGLLSSRPWLTLMGVGLIYLGTLPFSLRAYQKAATGADAGAGEELVEEQAVAPDNEQPDDPPGNTLH